jgi:hypothetical protein
MVHENYFFFIDNFLDLDVFYIEFYAIKIRSLFN